MRIASQSSVIVLYTFIAALLSGCSNNTESSTSVTKESNVPSKHDEIISTDYEKVYEEDVDDKCPYVTTLYIDYLGDDYHLIASIEDDSEIDLSSIDLRIDGRQINSYHVTADDRDYIHSVVLDYPLGILNKQGERKLSLQVSDVFGNRLEKPVVVIQEIQ